MQLAVSLLFALFSGHLTAATSDAKLPTITVTPGETTQGSPIASNRIFGQFFERVTFGEPGPEPFVDPATGNLPDTIMEKMQAMQIPVLRFPGGTDVDFTDWTDMIDLPSRAERPSTAGRKEGEIITNHFGYDEYFAVRDQLGCETILVINLMDALLKKKSISQGAIDAVGLLAYANAEVGASLPEGMPDWPSIRTSNGHPNPFGTEYI